MPVYQLPITHRPERDGRMVDSRHVPFYLALEVVADAWNIALVETCGDALTAGDLAIVHVDGDFENEILTGTIIAGVTLVKIGRSSLHFSVSLEQGGRSVANVATVLCRVDAGRTRSLALSDRQRAALAPLLSEDGHSA